ncbi:hypothetical protein [Pseudalkalibacillus salsuginis]|uniref:hypothetical protein n=1 Tax=Pseudalkalibacillus salsuginis TaxID=2910972 RepID=UPI001F3FC20F|nr:hypothetical protein [Pseudalkalibacillus salsuginis]MCF6410822.1 hypothetical protein [Pseudalkalibacillus salsuginis]
MRFLVSYLVILLIPVLIGMYAYDKTVSVMDEDAEKANFGFEPEQTHTGHAAGGMEQMATELAVNPKVLQKDNVNLQR